MAKYTIREWRRERVKVLRVSLRGRERGRVSSSLRAAFRLPVLLFFFFYLFLFICNKSVSKFRMLVQVATPKREHPCVPSLIQRIKVSEETRWNRRARRSVKRDDIGVRGNLQGNFVTLFSARLCIGRAIWWDHHGVPFWKYEPTFDIYQTFSFKHWIHIHIIKLLPRSVCSSSFHRRS